MKVSLLANILLLLYLQAALLVKLTSQETESQNIEEFEEMLRKLDANETGKISKPFVEKVKKNSEKFLTNLLKLEEQYKDGEISIKEHGYANKEEKYLYEEIRTYDTEKKGKISASELNEMKNDYVNVKNDLDEVIKMMDKDSEINIEDFMSRMKKLREKYYS